jgi:HD-like signal output (HDOD) protein
VSANLTNKIQEPESDAAFNFVRSLATELSSGNLDLPSFPEVAARIRRILSDPKSTLEQVVRVVSSEPTLAARLLRIANSASLNRSGKVISDLRTAINHIGYNMVRSASISYSMAQVRKSNKLTGLGHHLEELWERSISVAAFAYVLARECSKVNPDEAMLTGMMHGIGKLYVLTRVIDHPELFASQSALNQIIEDWHASIAKAILEHWNLSEPMVQAVADQSDLDRAVDGPADLTDVIVVAILMDAHARDIAGLEAVLPEVAPAQRLGLLPARLEELMAASAAEISALNQALGS